MSLKGGWWAGMRGSSSWGAPVPSGDDHMPVWLSCVGSCGCTCGCIVSVCVCVYPSNVCVGLQDPCPYVCVAMCLCVLMRPHVPGPENVVYHGNPGSSQLGRGPSSSGFRGAPKLCPFA